MSLFQYLIYQMTVSSKRFLASHFLIPLLSLAILSIAIDTADIDRLMADYFYAIQGNSWAWKDSWLTEVFFHKGGRSASIVLALISLVLLGLSFFNLTLATHKKPLLYLFLATAGSSLLIGFLKSSLAISCPWSLIVMAANLATVR
jgi:membrane-associated PAP2 superfamily phosphatase